MACAYQCNVGDKERSLLHHGLIKILVSYRLGELGDSWESFLARNEFGENDEWPRWRSKTRWRHNKTEVGGYELEEFDSENDLDNEISEPNRTLRYSDLKLESEVNPETPVDDSQPWTSKPMITAPYPNDGLPYSQKNVSHKSAEDEVSRVLSNLAIHRTTRSMTAMLFASRDLSIWDAPVIELSNSSESHSNEAPIGPIVLDLKYVSASKTRVGDVQQLNPGPNVDQEIDQNPCL